MLASSQRNIPVHFPSPIFRKLQVYSFIIIGLVVSAPARANTSFSFGAADQFAVLYDLEGTSGITLSENNGSISGAIGIGSGGKLSLAGGCSGPCPIGAIYFENPVNGTDYSASGSYTPAPNPIQNNALVASAVTSLNDLYATYSPGGVAIPATMSAPDLSNVTNNVAINVASGTVNVMDVSNIGVGQCGQIAINGSASAFVVINVSGTVNFNDSANQAGSTCTGHGSTQTGSLVLNGGITADHVLINITSTTNNNLSSSGSALYNIVNADILDAYGNYQLNQITVDGRVFGGNANSAIVSVFAINAPTTTATPEPATVVLALAGIVLIVRQRRKV